MSVTNKLKNISLFNAFKDNEVQLNKLEEIIDEVAYPKDTYIIKEGDVGKAMFILARGTVSIEKTTPMGDSFSVAKLSDVNNFFFGELALLDNDVRSAAVQAVTDTVCYVIDKDKFDKFCEENPRIGYFIIKDIAISLARRLRKTTNDNLLLINALCCDDEMFNSH